MSLWSKNQPCIPGGKLDFSECTTHLYSLLDLILKKKKSVSNFAGVRMPCDFPFF